MTEGTRDFRGVCLLVALSCSGSGSGKRGAVRSTLKSGLEDSGGLWLFNGQPHLIIVSATGLGSTILLEAVLTDRCIHLFVPLQY